MTQEMNLQKGLVGHWTMDDRDTEGTTLKDSSAYDNDGTLVNSPTTGQTSIIGESYSFTPSNSEEITMPNIGFSGNESITIAVWHKIDSGAGDNNNLFGFGTTGVGSQSCSIRTNSDGEYRFYFWQNDLDVNVGSGFFGEWTHTVARYDSDTSDRAVYHNSTRINSDSPQNPDFQDQDYRIGGFNNEYIDGLIGEVRVYNRALSDAEINQLYQMRELRRRKV